MLMQWAAVQHQGSTYNIHNMSTVCDRSAILFPTTLIDILYNAAFNQYDHVFQF
jgi:hypothetical protein